jgi:aminoglycoside phosphotransferase (APT) family kinase protein
MKLHADAWDIDTRLVRQIIDDQFPHWQGLPLRAVDSSGTENVLYRLGDEYVVRLPMRPSAVPQIAREATWLPVLAPQVPLPIPQPLGVGEAVADYPAPWAVYRWLPGETGLTADVPDQTIVARQLADFVRALWQVPVPADAPVTTGPYARGVPLANRRAITAEALEAAQGLVDAVHLNEIWHRAVMAPTWAGAPVWVHGDIQPSNLLFQHGQISAVLDFGTLGVGDPAVDLLVAWNYLDAPARQVFRGAVAVDDATWCRGLGWALSVALLQLPYYLHTNPVMVASARRVIAAVSAEE